MHVNIIFPCYVLLYRRQSFNRPINQLQFLKMDDFFRLSFFLFCPILCYKDVPQEAQRNLFISWQAWQRVCPCFVPSSSKTRSLIISSVPHMNYISVNDAVDLYDIPYSIKK